MRVTKRAGTVMAATTLVVAGMTGGMAATASAMPGGGGGCTGAPQVTHGGVGYDSFSMTLDALCGNYSVQVYGTCPNGGQQYGSEAYGAGSVSKITCQGFDNVISDSGYGYRYDNYSRWVTVSFG